MYCMQLVCMMELGHMFYFTSYSYSVLALCSIDNVEKSRNAAAAEGPYRELPVEASNWEAGSVSADEKSPLLVHLELAADSDGGKRKSLGSV